MAEQKQESEQVETLQQPDGIAEEQFGAQSLTDHLRELRSCLMISLAAVIAGFAASMALSSPLAPGFSSP